MCKILLSLPPFFSFSSYSSFLFLHLFFFFLLFPPFSFSLPFLIPLYNLPARSVCRFGLSTMARLVRLETHGKLARLETLMWSNLRKRKWVIASCRIILWKTSTLFSVSQHSLESLAIAGSGEQGVAMCHWSCLLAKRAVLALATAHASLQPSPT
jgi:hypothetical protein